MNRIIWIRELRRILNLLNNAKYTYLAYLFLSAASIAAMVAIHGTAYKEAVNALVSLEYRRFMFAALVVSFSLLVPLFGVPIFSVKINFIYKTAMANIRKETYVHMLWLPARYFEKMHSGELLSRLTSDLNLIEGVLQRQLCMVIQSALIGGAALVACFLLHWKLAIVSVVLGMATAAFSLLYVSLIRKCSDRIQATLGKLSQHIIDIRDNTRTIKLFGLYRFIKTRSEHCSGVLLSERKKLTKKESQIAAINNAMSYVSQFVILCIGIVMMKRGTADLGTITGVMSLRLAIDDLFVEFGGFAVQLQKALSGSSRFFDFADEEEGRLSQRYLCHSPRNRQDESIVSMKGVTFSYEDDRVATRDAIRVLSNCTMSIPANSVTAIIGPNGAGKTTIARILLGLYAPADGQIELSVNMDSPARMSNENGPVLESQLANCFSYVPQEPVIFRGTIAENITLCLSTGSMNFGRLITSSRAAGVHDFVKDMPEYYDTVLGEDGCNLSGGQRQRINVARALYHDRPVYLFDEATSALDTKTEECLHAVIAKLATNRTVIVIAHRPAIIERAATVYRLAFGKMVLVRKQ